MFARYLPFAFVPLPWAPRRWRPSPPFPPRSRPAIPTRSAAECPGRSACISAAVEEDGRYLVLEDGSRWEVEISDRATTASWVADDFVNLSWIAAPRGDFEYLLSRVGDLEQRAAVRLAGRDPGPAAQE